MHCEWLSMTALMCIWKSLGRFCIQYWAQGWSLHSRRWNGLGSVIFAANELLPASLSQSRLHVAHLFHVDLEDKRDAISIAFRFLRCVCFCIRGDFFSMSVSWLSESNIKLMAELLTMQRERAIKTRSFITLIKLTMASRTHPIAESLNQVDQIVSSSSYRCVGDENIPNICERVKNRWFPDFPIFVSLRSSAEVKV